MPSKTQQAEKSPRPLIAEMEPFAAIAGGEFHDQG